MERLTKSLANYLSAIYEITIKGEKLSPKTVGEITGFNKASTLEGIKALQKRGLVEYVPYKALKLTDSGMKYSENMIKRRNVISIFLEKFLLVEKEKLGQEACELETSISDYLFERLNFFLDFSTFCPNDGPKWIEGFKKYMEQGEMTDKCAKCIEGVMSDNNPPLCN